MAIRDKDIPEAQLMVEHCIETTKKATKFMIKLVEKQKNKQILVSVFTALKRNIIYEKGANRKINRCMQILRKFHTFAFFHRYRRIVHWEVVIRSKDSI